MGVLRQIENSGVKCERCGGRVWKDGKSKKGDKRYRCVECGKQFTVLGDGKTKKIERRDYGGIWRKGRSKIYKKR